MGLHERPLIYHYLKQLGLRPKPHTLITRYDKKQSVTQSSETTCGILSFEPTCSMPQLLLSLKLFRFPPFTHNKPIVHYD